MSSRPHHDIITPRHHHTDMITSPCWLGDESTGSAFGSVFGGDLQQQPAAQQRVSLTATAKTMAATHVRAGTKTAMSSLRSPVRAEQPSPMRVTAASAWEMMSVYSVVFCPSVWSWETRWFASVTVWRIETGMEMHMPCTVLSAPSSCGGAKAKTKATEA